MVGPISSSMDERSALLPHLDPDLFIQTIDSAAQRPISLVLHQREGFSEDHAAIGGGEDDRRDPPARVCLLVEKPVGVTESRQEEQHDETGDPSPDRDPRGEPRPTPGGTSHPDALNDIAFDFKAKQALRSRLRQGLEKAESLGEGPVPSSRLECLRPMRDERHDYRTNGRDQCFPHATYIGFGAATLEPLWPRGDRVVPSSNIRIRDDKEITP